MRKQNQENKFSRLLNDIQNKMYSLMNWQKCYTCTLRPRTV